jgi:CubicO group peptidase (beta-lactamase class C family)
MRRRTAMMAAALGSALAAPQAAGPAVAATPAAAPAAALDDTLRPFLASHGLPALFAAVARGAAVVAAGAVGTRRAGAEIPVASQDRVHIGSNTKAMTAMLAGMLVEQGRIAWDTGIGAAFPEFREGMDPGLASVTLEQLLSHTGGVQPDDETLVRLLVQVHLQEGLNLDEMRRWMVGRWRARAPASPPGARFAYANMGYLIAGAMIEAAAGAPWEVLAATRIFDPLGLGTAGFGPQSSLGRVDAPLPHIPRPDGAPPKPMMAGPNADNPLVLGPAGTVHLSILDFAAWAAWHAGGGRRGPALVRPETLRRLHAKAVDMPPRPDAPPGTPGTGGYGHGWGFVQMPWAPGVTLLTHNGSNGMNLANITLDPGRDLAIVLATNIGGTRADAALKALVEALYRRFA